MTLETAEAVEDLTMSTDGTAYIVTTIALLGGVLAFYYFYIYNNPDEVCVQFFCLLKGFVDSIIGLSIVNSLNHGMHAFLGAFSLVWQYCSTNTVT